LIFVDIQMKKQRTASTTGDIFEPYLSTISPRYQVTLLILTFAG